MTLGTQEKLDWLKTHPEDTIRVCGKDFKEMLLDNYSMIIGGDVRHLQGLPLGGDVFAIRLLPKSWDSETHGTVMLAAKTPWMVEGKSGPF